MRKKKVFRKSKVFTTTITITSAAGMVIRRDITSLGSARIQLLE